MEQTGYQIVHAIVGRIRIRISWLETDSEAAAKLQRLIESINFVTSARINPLAASIVVVYKPKGLTLDEAQERFVEAIQQIKPTPLIVPPPPPEPIKAEPPAQTATTPPQPDNAAVASEIPSPWDENDVKDSIAIEHSEPVEPPAAAIAPDTSNPAEVELPHSTTALAQRLGVTVQAITRRRSKPDFATWTQAQDPDRIAWHYDADSRSFHSITAP